MVVNVGPFASIMFPVLCWQSSNTTGLPVIGLISATPSSAGVGRSGLTNCFTWIS